LRKKRKREIERKKKKRKKKKMDLKNIEETLKSRGCGSIRVAYKAGHSSLPPEPAPETW